MEPTISHSIDVAAAPGVVWALVSDLPRMGRFSPENLGGRWLRGATGPAVGVEFRGFNRNGAKLWWTTARIVACEPERLLTFDVRSPLTVRVARWSYVITPTRDGCVVTENWYRVGNWFVRRFLGPRVTGREDRPGYNVDSIKHTLAAVKAHAESLGDVRRARRTSTSNAP
ncbi:SRPBCC family protein [Actinosynnema sp. NPDC002837]